MADFNCPAIFLAEFASLSFCGGLSQPGDLVLDLLTAGRAHTIHIISGRVIVRASDTAEAPASPVILSTSFRCSKLAEKPLLALLFLLSELFFSVKGIQT